MPFSMKVEITAATLVSVKSYGWKACVMTTTEDLVRIDGQHHEILKRVGNGSLDPEEVRGALQRIIEGRFYNSDLIHDMFVSPEAQLANVRSWNISRSWGFTEEDFRAAEAVLEQQAWPSDRLTVLVLVPYLANVGITFEELWVVAFEQQPNHWRWEELKSTPDNLRLLEDIEHKPGLRWEVIDLGANWDAKTGVRPMDVRDASSAHAGVLASAAHFPKWVQAMDGTKVPFVWLPGYQATIPGYEAWTSVPCLSWGRDDREVQLDASWSDDRPQRWAAPVVRGVLN